MRSDSVTGTRREFRRLRPGSPAPILLALIAIAMVGCGSTGTPATTAPASATAVPTASPSVTPSPTIAPTDTPDPTAPPTAAPTPAPASGTWTMNVYNVHDFLYQNPDLNACTAASAQVMLNMATTWTDYKAVPGKSAPSKPHGWKVDVSHARMEVLLAYERKNGTMRLSDGGADAHGWRNALNYYGWGGITANVYKDMAFKTFGEAVRATVLAVAMYRKPVGILASAGVHAQIVTGYRVKGYDPRTGSTNFQILGVYLSDPLKSHGYLNAYIPLGTWSGGVAKIRLTPYTMTNSPYVDSLDHQQGNAEWDGKWVIVAPVA